jgi:hypothetical protein
MKKRMAMKESMPIAMPGFPDNETTEFGSVPGCRVFPLPRSSSREA